MSILGSLASRVTGGLTQIQTAFGDPQGEQSLKAFLEKISSAGTLLNCRYEVNCSGIKDITFFLQSISVPGVQLQTTQVFWEGQSIMVPQIYSFDHQFSMTVIADGNGYIYSALNTLMNGITGDTVMDSGIMMTIRALGDKNVKGMMTTMNGVQFTQLGSISYANSSNSVMTFNVTGYAQVIATVPGTMAQVAGIAGAAGQALGALTGR